MATVRWHRKELSGQTLTLLLVPLASDTTANGDGADTLTEGSNGSFTATVAESLTGWHMAYAHNASMQVRASGFVNMSDASPVVVETVAAASAPASTVVGRFDDPDADSPNVTWKVGEIAKTKSVTCEDGNGDPIDLTDYGEFYVVIERDGIRADVQVIEYADLTVSGDDNNVLTFQADEDVLAEPGDFRWSARQTDESEIATGRITVTYSPIKDVAP